MKHLTRLFILTALICSCSFYAGAQTAAKTETAVPKGAASYIDTFFKKYKTSPDSAIDYIFGTNPFFTGSQIAPLKAKLDSLQFILGKYVGKELIAQKSATPSLVLYSYLVKHENQPIRFVFMFYKPKNDWLLYRFNFDDAMDVELLEASRINNKRP
jgi:hypothetical protein